MKIGVIVLNFGEPSNPTIEEVVPFLERIFLANANLESQPDEEARRRRSRELAERRAPGLIEEYLEIGGSPLNDQARDQADALSRELSSRDIEVQVYSAFQFTEPLIGDVVARARADGAELLIGVPIYPLCGPSTTVASLDQVQAAIDGLGWDVEFRGVSGWHRHPLYPQLRADAVRRCAESAGIDLQDPETRLVFSAHGTPIKYLDDGSRYVEYVTGFCEDQAKRLAVEAYGLGYQNHSNRGIEWTQPDVEDVVRESKGTRVLVDAVSFMHEQSETLAELDGELREVAEGMGLEFVRVPIPHDDPRLARLLADCVEALLDPDPTSSELGLAPCRCRPTPETYCLNARPR
jgi:protoporphyrin/coproporphyrin ferrochelatase